MTKEKEHYQAICKELPDVEESQMFGKPCFKINKKAFVCFFQNEMVFKLPKEIHIQAISLEGSTLFDPSGKKRPMKEWVQVPFEHADRWKEFAEVAKDYIMGNL